MRTNARNRQKILAIVPVLAIGGCTPVVTDATIAALHDSATSLVSGIVDTIFETIGTTEGNGNDLFIHN